MVEDGQSSVFAGANDLRPRIVEIECKSLLNKSGLADWAVNCYAGCEHGCCYCYARFATRFAHPREAWGSFVDVKANAPQILVREVKRKPAGRVFMSSVCDGWQQSEARYELTRQCLEILLRHGFPITILTKSALIRRDFDLLKSKKEVELGVTITTLDENLREIVEPKGSPCAERLAILDEAKQKGMTTYAFLGPFMPKLSDTEESLSLLLRAVKEVNVDYVYVDQLNPGYAVWPSLKALLLERFPDLVETCGQILFKDRVRREYSGRLLTVVQDLARKVGIDDRMKVFF